MLCTMHYALYFSMHYGMAGSLSNVRDPAIPQCILKYSLCSFYKMLSSVQLFATSWTAARQAPVSVGFSR